MLYNRSGPRRVEDGGISVRGVVGQSGGATHLGGTHSSGLGLPTTSDAANCSSASATVGSGSYLNQQQYPSYNRHTTAANSSPVGGTTDIHSDSTATANRGQQSQGLGQFCQPGTHQHYPGALTGGQPGYEPQPHVTVSYAGAYNPAVGVGGGQGSKGPLHAAQNPHWTHRQHHHPHHPAAATTNSLSPAAAAAAVTAAAKHHHSWMANYHGFITPIR